MKYLVPYNNFNLVTESRKYEHINFIPPKTVSNKAKKGLKYRRKYKPVTGELAVKIANKLARRDKLTPSQIKQISSHFSRMGSRELNTKYQNEPWKDKKYVKYLLWGGETGRAWVERIRTQIVKADKK